MSLVLLRTLPDRTPRWAGPVVVGAISLAAVTTIGVLDPELRGHLSPGCPFRTVTGLDCPGCGATRAVYALTQGDVGVALDHNVLVVLGLPVFAVAWLLWLLAGAGLRARPLVVPPMVSYGIAGLLVVFWVARNLPWAPLLWLGSGVT